ncbi:hypothetical protein ADL26_06305 [Thermoactinomyces vulgaris]|nr:hypothetical protein ADL26_06305 [Thermoactinomyces vulgaris]
MSFLWCLGLVGLLGLAYHQLQPDYLEYQQLKQEGERLTRNLKRYEKYTASTYQLPIEPSQAELAGLEKKVPVMQNQPDYVVQLEQAVNTAGASWKKIELLDDISELFKSPAQAKDSATIPPDTDVVNEQLGIVSSEELRPIWIKLEVQATQNQFTNLLHQLQQGERLATVVGWNYQWTDDTKAESGVVYLALYSYQDERVKQHLK